MDHSEQSRRALHVAAELAERLDSRLVLVHVRPSPADLPPGMALQANLARERAVEGGQRLLTQFAGQLVNDSGASRLLESVHGRLEFGEPAARLAAAGDEVQARLIVVGAQGRGRAASLVLGSVSQSLAAGLSRPVLVVPPGVTGLEAGSPEGRRVPSIVCGVDCSAAAANAARAAAQLAGALGLRLVLVHVEKDGEQAAAGEIEFESLLDPSTRPRLRLVHRVMEVTADARVEACLAAGKPSESLEEVAARESAELIAVGTRGHGALKALALGSTARTLAASGSRPVLIANDRPSAWAVGPPKDAC